jgi:hypothetical protein
MSCRGLIAAVATVAAILSGGAGAGLAPAQSRQEPDLAAYNLGVAAAVRSDLAASVRLPDGGQVYVFGGHARGQRPGNLRLVPLPARLSARFDSDPAAQRLERHRALARRHPAMAGQARARMRMDLLGRNPPGQPGSPRHNARILGQQP